MQILFFLLRFLLYIRIFLYLLSYSVVREIQLFFTEFPLNRAIHSNSIVINVEILPVNDQPKIFGHGINSLTLTDYLPEDINIGFTVSDFLPSDQVLFYLILFTYIIHSYVNLLKHYFCI